mgnify:CR=1 FL=1
MDGLKRKVLAKARKLISIGWTRNAIARNNKNQEVSVLNDDATCFCLWGATLRAAYDLEVMSPYPVTHSIMRELNHFIPDGMGAIQFNDQCVSKKPVLDLIDRALEGKPA